MALPAISRFSNRVALVTGASVGIGASISEALVKSGLIVVGCARNVAPIQNRVPEYTEKGYSGKLFSYQCDIRNDGEIEKMFQWIEEHHGGVDVCVNNAGITVAESLLDSDPAQVRDMFNVNVIALLLCTKLTVKSLQARGVDDGHIININSILGHVVKGILPSYTGTKYAVTALTDGFRRELHQANSNIRISAISPGLTHTHLLDPLYGAEKANELLASSRCLQPEDVANAVLHALSQPAHVQVHDILLEATRNTM